MMTTKANAARGIIIGESILLSPPLPHNKPHAAVSLRPRRRRGANSL
jgi:hypothetical protein